jgi:hypothetical protein
MFPSSDMLVRPVPKPDTLGDRQIPNGYSLGGINTLESCQLIYSGTSVVTTVQAASGC